MGARMSWAYAAAGLNVAGGVMGFMGSSKSAKSARAVAEYNAQIAERNARVMDQAAEQKVFMGDMMNVRAVQEYNRFLDSAETAYNNSGVIATTGTPALVALESARAADQDLATTDYNTKVAALQLREQGTGLRMQANLTRMEGAARAQAYKMQGYQSLLGGATSAAGAMMFA